MKVTNLITFLLPFLCACHSLRVINDTEKRDSRSEQVASLPFTLLGVIPLSSDKSKACKNGNWKELNINRNNLGIYAGTAIDVIPLAIAPINPILMAVVFQGFYQSPMLYNSFDVKMSCL